MSFMAYFVDADGNYLGAWGPGTEFPENGIQVPFPPQDGRQKWLGNTYSEVPEQVPEFVTMRQAQRQLASVGLLAQVQLAIESMEGEAGVLARIDWNTAGKLERNNPLLVQLAGQLELTTKQLDELFIAASKL